jgi:hypothetical protein
MPKFIRTELIDCCKANNTPNHVTYTLQVKPEGEDFPDDYFFLCYSWNGKIWHDFSKRVKKYNNISSYCYLTPKGWNALKAEILPASYEYYRSRGNYSNVSFEEFSKLKEQDIQDIYDRVKEYPIYELEKLRRKQIKVNQEMEKVSLILSNG